MRSRSMPLTGFPTKNQETSVTLPNGRTYAICSKGQYVTVRNQAKSIMIANALEAGLTIEDDEINRRLDEWQENESSFATMSWVLSKLTPKQVDEYKASYRFKGIHRFMRT